MGMKEENEWLLEVMMIRKEGKKERKDIVVDDKGEKKEAKNCMYDINENSDHQSTSSDDATPWGPSLHHREGHRLVGGGSLIDHISTELATSNFFSFFPSHFSSFTCVFEAMTLAGCCCI